MNTTAPSLQRKHLLATFRRNGNVYETAREAYGLSHQKTDDLIRDHLTDEDRRQRFHRIGVDTLRTYSPGEIVEALQASNVTSRVSGPTIGEYETYRLEQNTKHATTVPSSVRLKQIHGSWKDAVAAAGYERPAFTPRSDRKWTDERMISALTIVANAHQRRLPSMAEYERWRAQVTPTLTLPSAVYVRTRLGGWTSARATVAFALSNESGNQ